MAPCNILVVYHAEGQYPLRNTVYSHLYCWQRYSQHRMFYVNVAFGLPPWVSKIPWDGIIFHTTFLGTRWDPQWFARLVTVCLPLKDLACMKLALPQDEFLQTEPLGRFIHQFGITHLLTCADPQDWDRIYPTIDRQRVSFKTVLTGYLEEQTLHTLKRLSTSTGHRPIDIGYRAWQAQYWLGEHGMHKVWIAEKTVAAAQKLGLVADISLKAKDTLFGDNWFRFLLQSRATVGVEGGASLLDADGRVKARVEQYLEHSPQATFEDVRRYCFPDEDHRLGLACLSPRHLEACATKTAQVLIEGHYNGILKPWMHYLPVQKDYSNLETLLDMVNDHDRMAQMTQQAYEDVVLNPRWTYRAFVQEIEMLCFAHIQPPPASLQTHAVYWLCRTHDAWTWDQLRRQRQANRLVS